MALGIIVLCEGIQREKGMEIQKLRFLSALGVTVHNLCVDLEQ